MVSGVVFVRKLEFAHKQVGGYLISYSLQIAFVRKLEFVHKQVGGYLARCARNVASIALNAMMNRYWISLSLGQRCSGSKKIFLAVWYIRWLTLNLLRNKIKSGNRISPSLVCLRHNDVSGGGSFANKKREIPINLTARWPQNEKNTLRDGGRSIPQICQFRYTTALFRPAIVNRRGL